MSRRSARPKVQKAAAVGLALSAAAGGPVAQCWPRRYSTRTSAASVGFRAVRRPGDRRAQTRGRVASAALPSQAEALRALGLDLRDPPDRKVIKKAFRREVLKSHPDFGGDPERFKEIKAAYEVLTGRAVSDGPPGPFNGQAPRRPGWQDFGGTANSRQERENLNEPYDPSNPWERQSRSELRDLWREIGYNPITGEGLDYSASGDPGWQNRVKESREVPGANDGARRADGYAKASASADSPTPARRDSRGFTFQTWLGVAAIAAVLTANSNIGTQLVSRVDSKGGASGGQAVQAQSTVRQVKAPATTAARPRQEVIYGVEYALAVSVANTERAPVFLGGLAPTPEGLRRWLEASQDAVLQSGPAREGLFAARPRYGAALDGASDEFLERLWAARGDPERTTLLVNTLRAVLDEPGMPGAVAREHKFGSVAAVVQNVHLQGVANRLADEGLQLVAVRTGLAPQLVDEHGGNSAELLKYYGPQAYDPVPQGQTFQTLSNRLVARFVRAATGQEVLLVGASPLPRTITWGASQGADSILSDALPEVRKALGQAPRPRAVVLDATSTAWRELSEDIVDRTGVNFAEGADVRAPTRLQMLALPAWAKDASR